MDKNEYVVLESEKMSTYDIDNICEILENGKIVVFPTETVYGIACNALDMKAVNKLYNIKRRDYNKPLLLTVGNIGSAYKYINRVDRNTKLLMERFWPGPLSIVLEKAETVPDYITNGSEKVGIRCTSHKLAALILNRCRVPIVATSANISGYDENFTIDQIINQFKTTVDVYIDGGKLKNNQPSTVVEIEANNNIRVLREGEIKKEDILKIIGYN